MKDRKSFQKVIAALNGQAIATDVTTAGNVIDLTVYTSRAITFVNRVDALTAGDVKLLIEDSSDNVTYTAVEDLFLVGLEDDTLIDAANTMKLIGYIGNKDYVKASLVSNNSADLYAAIDAIMEYPVKAPVALICCL